MRSLCRFQHQHGQHGGAHDQRHGLQALRWRRRRSGSPLRRVEDGGGVLGRDADGGGRQLLLLGRRGRGGALPERDAVRGHRCARPWPPAGAAVVLRAALRCAGRESARRGGAHVGHGCIIGAVNGVRWRSSLLIHSKKEISTSIFRNNCHFVYLLLSW